MSALSLYQQRRRANLNENSEFLKEYGLDAPVVESTSVTRDEEEVEEPKIKRVFKKTRKPKSLKQPIPPEERRTSFRIRLKVTQDSFEDYESLKDSDEDEDTEEEDEVKEKELMKNLSQPNRNVVRPPRPNSYGSIPGVKVGTWWETRLDCNYDYIHRPTVAGIHQGPDGAFSVALSGGYEDDVDLGHFFTYTGEGGRDLKGTANNPKNLRTAPQSKHQTLTRGNLALSRNVETGNPVRVIRGYKLRSKFAPERGYRYDGLYNVTRYWEAVGKAGYKIFKYEFQRCDPEPAPWDKSSSPVKGQTKADYYPDKDNDEDYCMDIEDNDSEEWRGWPDEPSVPKASTLTIRLLGTQEQVNLNGDTWCRVSDKTSEGSSPNSSSSQHQKEISSVEKSALCDDFLEGLDSQGLGCNAADAESSLEPLNWLGWPEVDFSILDCPQSFKCVLKDV